MTTIDTPAVSRRAPRPTTRAGVTVRRWACAVSLIVFPALLVVADLIALEDGAGSVMYAAAAEHRTALVASAVLLMVSGILMLPATVGILRQARDRGAALANVAAVFAVLGGVGHVGLGYFYVLSGALQGGDRTEMVAYIERLNASTWLAVLAFPLLLCFSLGVLLLPWAAFRAGLAGIWLPVLATLAVLQHLALPPEFPAQEAINTVALAALTVVFGHLGVRALRTSDAGWVC